MRYYSLEGCAGNTSVRLQCRVRLRRQLLVQGRGRRVEGTYYPIQENPSLGIHQRPDQPRYKLIGALHLFTR